MVGIRSRCDPASVSSIVWSDLCQQDKITVRSARSTEDGVTPKCFAVSGYSAFVTVLLSKDYSQGDIGRKVQENLPQRIQSICYEIADPRENVKVIYVV